MLRLAPCIAPLLRPAILSIFLLSMAAGSCAQQVESAPVTVTDAQLQEAYEQSKQGFRTLYPDGLEYEVRHLMVPSREEADAALARIHGGEPFASVASQVSKDPASARRGGSLGWVGPGSFPPAFTAAVLALRPGETNSAPVRTPFGWHLVQVLNRREVHMPPFDAVKERIRGELAKKAQQAVVAQAPAASTAYSDADGLLLWGEAIATFNGLAYDYTEYVFGQPSLANACAGNFDRTCERGALKTVRHKAERGNELPLQLRDAIVMTTAPNYAAPVADAAAGTWTVVQVGNAQATTFVGAVNPREWVAQHAAVALPPADALRNDPELKIRSAMNKIRSADDLRQALATQQMDKAHIDAFLSNGDTLLLKALYLKSPELLDALLAEGARPDTCGKRSCPLATAILIGYKPGLRWLLAHGANPEGAPGEVTSLMTASGMADRESAEVLLQAGANPLATHTEKVLQLQFRRSVPFYAASSDPAYLEWISGVVQAALAKTGRYEWQAWIEQAGVRRPITDGGAIVLKRQPFRIVMRLPEGEAMQMAASTDDSFAGHAGSVVFRRRLLAPAKIGASGPDASYLGIGTPAMQDGEWDFDGATQYLAYTTDAGRSVGVKRVEDGARGPVDAYEVTELIADRRTIPIADSTAGTLTLLFGLMSPTGTGADLYRPTVFKLAFR